MVPVEVEHAQALRHRLELDEIDYRRELARLVSSGMSVSELSHALITAEDAVSSQLEAAKKIDPVRPGFSGGSPREICLRYKAGQISRDQVIDQLVHWDYVPRKPVEDPYNDLLFDTPGSFDDVLQALHDGVLDGETYDIVLKTSAAEWKNGRSSSN